MQLSGSCSRSCSCAFKTSTSYASSVNKRIRRPASGPEFWSPDLMQHELNVVRLNLYA